MIGGVDIAAKITYKPESGLQEGFGLPNFSDRELYNYNLEHEPENLEDLKEILRYLISASQNPEQRTTSQILLNLISHKNKVVVASTLGKLFLLTSREPVQKIIAQELRNLSHDSNTAVRKIAMDSLELIAGEVYQWTIFHGVFVHFHGLSGKVKSKLQSKNKTINLNYITFFYFLDRILSLVKPVLFNDIIHFSRITNLFQYILIIPDTPQRMSSGQRKAVVDEVARKSKDKFSNEELIAYLDLINLEHIDDDPVTNLAIIYAQTFREKGHLRRLEGLINDENPGVQLSGIRALIQVVNFLIN